MNERLPQDIVLRPVITEKATDALHSGKYTFEVSRESNKIEIKNAVEKLFSGVKVDTVNTISVRGRFRRQGRNGGYTPSWKKAIVKLKAGSKSIEFFDGMV